MTKPDGKVPIPSRQVFLRSSAIVAAQSAGSACARASEVDEFESWEAERAAIERELDRTPEANEAARNRLFERSDALERRIITTPCRDVVAACTKARLPLWYMEMERADGLPAMRHLCAYLDQL